MSSKFMLIIALVAVGVVQLATALPQIGVRALHQSSLHRTGNTRTSVTTSLYPNQSRATQYRACVKITSLPPSPDIRSLCLLLMTYFVSSVPNTILDDYCGAVPNYGT